MFDVFAITFFCCECTIVYLGDIDGIDAADITQLHTHLSQHGHVKEHEFDFACEMVSVGGDMQVADIDFVLLAHDLHDAHEDAKRICTFDVQRHGLRHGVLGGLQGVLLFAEILFEAVFGFGGHCDLQPLGFGFLLAGGEDLYLVATLQDIVNGARGAIDIGADTMFA